MKNYLLISTLISVVAMQGVIVATSVWAVPTTDYYRIDNGTDNTIDQDDDSASGTGGSCTLRDAISAANSSAGIGLATNGCTVTAIGSPSANVYVIFLPTGGYIYTLNGTELLTSVNTVSIVGDTAANTIIQANASADTATYRVLNNNGATVDLYSITIRHGRCVGACAASTSHGGGLINQSGTLNVVNSAVNNNSAGHGGGILSWNGTLTVTNSTVSGNSVTENGGGVLRAGGTATMTDSTVSGNSAAGNGGGIYSTGPFSLISSTVSENTAQVGGGINNEMGTLTVTNSTVSGNSATINGGGISTWGYITPATTTVINSTVSGNNSPTGGGLYSSMATIHLTNTIIAGSIAGSDCASTLATNINNLIEDNTCSPAISGDPNLGPLQDNGGPTFTQALPTGSPAIDAGDATACANAPVNGVDQRGVSRPQGGGCDIGAYEYELKSFPWPMFLPAIENK